MTDKEKIDKVKKIIQMTYEYDPYEGEAGKAFLQGILSAIEVVLDEDTEE